MEVLQANRRKNYMIDKSFQGKFIVKFCLVVMLASLLTGMLIYYFNLQTTTVAFENSKVVVKSTSDFILPIMVQILIMVTVAASFAAASVTLFTSHKIAGPVYRLKIELERMKKGDLTTDVQLRANDQLQKAAEELEGLRSELQSNIKELKKNYESVKQALDKNELSSAKDSIEKVESILTRFKTG